MSSVPVTRDLSLAPADNVRLVELCGPLDSHLHQIEARLGVEVRRRGNRFQIIGLPAAAQRAESVLQGALRPGAARAGGFGTRAHRAAGARHGRQRIRGGRRRAQGQHRARRGARPRCQSDRVSQQHPQPRSHVRHRPGRHRQDLSRRGLRGRGAAVGTRAPHRARAPGRRGRRAARVSARRSHAEGRPVPASHVRRALRNDGIRAGGEVHRAQRHRDRAARLHARPLA